MSSENQNNYIKGYKYRIYPTDSQKELIRKYIDLYRFVYNWGLALEESNYKLYKDGKSDIKFFNFFDLCQEFKKFKDLEENSWLKVLPNTTARLALRDVINSYNKFFKCKEIGHPKFKSKKRSPKMFKTRNERFYINGDKIRFEGLSYGHTATSSDLVDLHFDSGFTRDQNVKYIQPSISIDNLGNYWVSFSIETPYELLSTPKTEPIGIDVGIRHTMTLSTGEIFNRPKEKIDKLKRRLSRESHHYSRDINRRMLEARRTKTKYDDIPISKRSQKRKEKIQKLYNRISNIKKSFYHETIKNIVLRNPEAIVIETISTREITSNNSWATKMFDGADFYTMHKIIEDKCTKYNIPLIKADKQYPSTQMCSCCGHIKKLRSHHTYICPVCGNRMDRDVNAAINLRNLAV